MIEPTSPIDERLEHDRAQHLPPRGAERPQRGELAHPLRDRDRERVGDHEAADEQRDPAEAEQEVLDELRCPSLTSSCCPRPPAPRAGLDLGRRRGSAARSGATSWPRRRPASPRRRDQVELAAACRTALRGREVEDAIVAPPIESTEPEPGDAADPVLRFGPSPRRADRVADLEVLLLRRSRLRRSRSGRRRGPLARTTSLSGLKRWSARGVDAEAEGRRAAARRSPCRPGRSASTGGRAVVGRSRRRPPRRRAAPCTFVSSDSGTPAPPLSPSSSTIASLPLMTASVALYDAS